MTSSLDPRITAPLRWDVDWFRVWTVVMCVGAIVLTVNTLSTLDPWTAFGYVLVTGLNGVALLSELPAATPGYVAGITLPSLALIPVPHDWVAAFYIVGAAALVGAEFVRSDDRPVWALGLGIGALVSGVTLWL